MEGNTALTHHLFFAKGDLLLSVTGTLGESQDKEEKTLEYSHSRISSRISCTGLGNGTVVEYLHSIHKVLGSKPRTTTEK